MPSPSPRPIGYNGEKVGTSGCPKESKSLGGTGLSWSDDQYRVSAAVIIPYRLFAIGVGDPLSIHDEAIFVSAWGQRNLRFPAIAIALHRRFLRVPIVETAGDDHRTRLWSLEGEFYGLLLRLFGLVLRFRFGAGTSLFRLGRRCRPVKCIAF